MERLRVSQKLSERTRAVHVSNFNATETRPLKTDCTFWLLLPGLLSHIMYASKALGRSRVTLAAD